MNAEELENIFSHLQQIFEVNISYPFREKNVAAISASEISNEISIKQRRWKNYKIRVGHNTIDLNEENLHKFLELRPYLNALMREFENERILCQENFFKLLSLCCKAVESNHKNLDLSSILLGLLNSPCPCAPHYFILQSALHFNRLLRKWILVYHDTRMLSETIRSETYANHWPHEFINIETLAMCGFYYKGPYDCVKCAFCKTTFQQWKPSDIPIDEHLKYAPQCPLLNSHTPCRNISENSSIKFNKLLLKKRLLSFNSCEDCYNYD